jgi:hypothetical protein
LGYRGAIFDVDGGQATKDANVVALGVARVGDEELLQRAGALVTTLEDLDALTEGCLERRSR